MERASQRLAVLTAHLEEGRTGEGVAPRCLRHGVAAVQLAAAAACSRSLAARRRRCLPSTRSLAAGADDGDSSSVERQPTLAAGDGTTPEFEFAQVGGGGRPPATAARRRRVQFSLPRALLIHILLLSPLLHTSNTNHTHRT